MNPLVKCSMNAHKIKEFSEEEFNVNSDTYFFLRESHENNRKKPVGITARNGTMYNRVGIVSDPVEKHTDDGICSIKAVPYRERERGRNAQNARFVLVLDFSSHIRSLW